MNPDVIDALLAAMVQSGPGVSDLLFSVGKPPVVEEHGSLEEFPIDAPGGVLDLPLILQISAHLMKGDERLVADMARQGSCGDGEGEKRYHFRDRLHGQRQDDDAGRDVE
jgi:hypothetical protein